MILRLCLLVGISFLLTATPLSAQGGFHFGLKAGPSLVNQTWNEGERRIATSYHTNLFIESRDPNDRGSLFAQIGMHNRGSSITINNFGFGGGRIMSAYNYKNISLLVGAKKNVASSMNFQPYYLVGIRGEYNFSNNLEELITENCLNNPLIASCPYPDPNFINNFTYGITIGGGLELTNSEFFDTAVEFSFSPDLSYQIQRPELPNIASPQPGNTTLRELQIRNLSFEISLVLKFLREVIYTD